MTRSRVFQLVAATSCAVLLACILLEIVLRASIGLTVDLVPRVFKAATDPVYGLASQRQTRVYMLGKVVDLSTDTEGYRLTVGQPNDGKGIHLIGDSQVFGWGLSDYETIASRLQALLGGSFKVVNHGVPGYGPLEYAKVLKRIPSADFAIVLHTEENDLWDVYGIFKETTAQCGWLMKQRASPLACTILESDVVQLISVWLDEFEQRQLLTPIGMSDQSLVAARILGFRMGRLYELEGELRRQRLIITTVPWKGRFSEDWRTRYQPTPLSQFGGDQNLFRDDLGMAHAFVASGAAGEMYLAGDTHLSGRGAAFVAQQIYVALAALMHLSGKGTPK